MKLTFWLCFALISYAYLGYAVWLWLCVCLRQRPIPKKYSAPDVSIIIAVRNEEANLPTKLENLRLLNYPPDRLQIVVASDGSTDSTADILREQSADVVPVILEQSNGKGSALNEAVRFAAS